MCVCVFVDFFFNSIWNFTGEKEFMPLSSSKVNVKARLEFELGYYDIAV